MPSGIARLYVIPQLPQFLQVHPRIEFELSSTDRLVDPIEEGFDCVMRAGAPRDPQLIARPLGRLIVINCASADYLRRRGTPQNLADLPRHDLIHYVSTLGGRSEGFEYPESGGYRTSPMPGPGVVNNSDAYNAACLAGLGLIQAPEIGVREHLARGDLVEVLRDIAQSRCRCRCCMRIGATCRSACACSWIGSLGSSGPRLPTDTPEQIARLARFGHFDALYSFIEHG
jgi:DNA-binding transcriptional LysR family regulator